MFDSTEIRDDNFADGCEIQWKFDYKHFHASFGDSSMVKIIETIFISFSFVTNCDKFSFKISIHFDQLKKLLFHLQIPISSLIFCSGKLL